MLYFLGMKSIYSYQVMVSKSINPHEKDVVDQEMVL